MKSRFVIVMLAMLAISAGHYFYSTDRTLPN